jgi:hypothetical protein
MDYSTFYAQSGRRCRRNPPVLPDSSGPAFDWPALRDSLLRALEPFPEARLAVLAALEPHQAVSSLNPDNSPLDLSPRAK